MTTAQTRPALRIDYIDPDRNQGDTVSTGSSFDVAAGSQDALLPAVLVSQDRMDTVLEDDVGKTTAEISRLTANDKQYAIHEFLRGGGTIDYTALFDLDQPI
jgi:hypothetical protein